jgi:DNA-cytosine methyltransferase
MSNGQISLEKVGIKVDKYFASEIKPHGIKVTQDNYPNTIQIGDVTKVSYKNGILHSENGDFEVGKIDLLIGGSPCQNFSIACITEKRKGLEGEKSALFYEYLRLLKEVNPRYFLLENVGSMKKDDQQKISEYLGYKPNNINSKFFTAQLRNRLYWTNYEVLHDYHDKGIKLNDILTEGWSDREKSRCLLEGDSRPNTTPVKMFHRYYSSGFTTLIFKSQEHYIACKNHYDTYFKGMSAKEIDEKLNEDIDLSVYEGTRYLNQVELERLQSVPEGYTKSVDRNEAASLLGDGWTVDVISHLFKGLKEEVNPLTFEVINDYINQEEQENIHNNKNDLHKHA